MESFNQSKLENLDIATIQFIIFYPFDEFYYAYSINNLDSSHLIERQEVDTLLQHINFEILGQVRKLTQEFSSFVYFTEDKHLLELEQIPTDEDIVEMIKEKQHNQVYAQQDEVSKVSLFDKIKKGFDSLFN
jgi:hypothetical protein